MILARWAAPCRTLSGEAVRADFAALRNETLLFAFTTDRMEVGEHSGEFSVKLVTRGAEVYRIGGRLIQLEPGQILILNSGQEYSSAVNRPGTRSVSFFLPPAQVEAAVATLRRDHTTLLDTPVPPTDRGEVFQVPFRPREALANEVVRLTAAVQHARPQAMDRLEELVLETAALALRDVLALVPPGALTGWARRATREELLARILRARDFIHDHGGRVTLTGMADIACLSKFHFLRVFRQIMGCTPSEYARAVRLERGVERLRRGAPTRVAARAAGFTSSSAFFRALRRRSP